MARRASTRSPRAGLTRCRGARRRPQPRLLFWPEAAVTDPLADDRAAAPAPTSPVRAARAPTRMLGPGDMLLTGGLALHVDATAARVDGAANSVFVLGPGGTVVGRYDKAHLVPYGEYLPMRPLLSAIGLSRLAPGRPRLRRRARARARSTLPGGWGKVGLPALLRDHLLGRSGRPRQPPRLHLQPVERRLVRPLGPAAASRPGAAARRRGRPSGDPLDPDRDQRGDRRPRRVCSHRCRGASAGVIDAVLPPPAAGPTPVRPARQRHPAAARLPAADRARLRSPAALATGST